MDNLMVNVGGEWALPLGVLQGPGQGTGPDSPFGDVLGWIIVFFVIVWPILRGVLATARGQRKEFEERKGAGKSPSPGEARARRTLEEILEGKLERADVDVASRASKVEPLPPPPPRAPEARFGDRPSDESSAPVYAADDLYQSDRSEALAGDPYDEAAMEQDLVSEAKLRHIPSEDEVEASNASSGTQARGETSTGIVPRPRAAASAAGIPEATLGREDPEVFFRRLARPLTPWQKAVVLREVLGAPLSSRPSPTLIDLPD